MGLIDEISAEPRKQSHVTQCIAGRLFAALPDGDQAELDDAFGNLEYTTAAIQRVLSRRRINVNRTALQRHRNRQCACYEPRG